MHCLNTETQTEEYECEECKDRQEANEIIKKTEQQKNFERQMRFKAEAEVLQKDTAIFKMSEANEIMCEKERQKHNNKVKKMKQEEQKRVKKLSEKLTQREERIEELESELGEMEIKIMHFEAEEERKNEIIAWYEVLNPRKYVQSLPLTKPEGVEQIES